MGKPSLCLKKQIKKEGREGKNSAEMGAPVF
jgi:hypothetical protein